jgi:transcription elongation GreA/GreB family factor
MTLKQKVHTAYLSLVNEKINLIQNVLADLKESGANETKSTAGDKHETALAMLQIEQANKRTQLSELVQQKEVLQKLNPMAKAITISNGSLIKSNLGCFYISTSLGKIEVDEKNIISISLSSPLAKKLIGLAVGTQVHFNNQCYLIEEIM